MNMKMRTMQVLRQHLTPYWQLMRFDRPIGTLLLLWPTMTALWIAANGHPSSTHIFIFFFGVVVMRAAGCVINDWADRNFDPHVSRTRQRPLARGAIPAQHALALFIGLMFIALSLVIQLNSMAIQLSVVAALLATIYPFMKRYTYWPQVVLGMAFGMGIPMSFAAVQETLPPVAWVLFITNLLWTVAYDTEYAMVDRKDDLKAGIKSTAILFGDADRFIIGVLQAMTWFGLWLAGLRANLAWPYFVSLFVVAALFVYQQYLIYRRKPEQCFRAFLNNNWVGLTFFVGTLLGFWAQ